MKKSELKALIREAVEEMTNKLTPMDSVEPVGSLDESGPPNFPKKMRAKIIARYKKKYPHDEERANKAAFGTMWKIFYAKKKGHKKINEMWTAYEDKAINEEESKDNEADQEEEHDETDLSNPEEQREVDLAIQIKQLAKELLAMHGADRTDGAEEPNEKESEESEKGGEESEESEESTEKSEDEKV